MVGSSNYAPHQPLNIDDRRRRLVFRAWHRGIKELDLIFGNFVEQHVDEMSNEDCIWFEAVFEENDHEVLAWVTGDKEPPEKFSGPWMTQLQALDFMKLEAR